jgi:hypothetical protein
VHVCGLAHIGPPAQLHAPDTQASARAGSHAAHATPAAPQAASDGAAHVAPLQQPIGHDVALQLHAPATQACPVAQVVVQVPQWLLSALRSTQAPPHSV